MTLKTRRIRGVLIEIFKVLKGHVDVDCSRFFSLSVVLHGHSTKLFKPRCHTNLRQNVFSNRAVDLWKLFKPRCHTNLRKN